MNSNDANCSRMAQIAITDATFIVASRTTAELALRRAVTGSAVRRMADAIIALRTNEARELATTFCRDCGSMHAGNNDGFCSFRLAGGAL